FVTMTRTLPSTSPFPYTTLFRSMLGRPGVAGGVVRQTGNLPALGLQLDLPAILHPCLPNLLVIDMQDGAVGGFADGDRIAFPILDRKSTRLNSSHVKISYAVFCL